MVTSIYIYIYVHACIHAGIDRESVAERLVHDCFGHEMLRCAAPAHRYVGALAQAGKYSIVWYNIVWYSTM